MGDRANIYLLERDYQNTIVGGIYVYVHNGGYELPNVLKEALRHGRERWTDQSYLARILISYVAKQVGIDGLMGMGVSIQPGDNERPMLVVDMRGQRVGASQHPFVDINSSVKRWVPFETYVLPGFEAQDFRGDMESVEDRVEPLPAIERLLQEE